MSTADRRPIVLGITGASGAVYAVRLLDVLLAEGREVQLSISPAGAAVIRQELQLAIDLEHFTLDQLLPDRQRLAEDRRLERLRALVPDWACARGEATNASGLVRYFHHQDLLAPMASGSARSGGMVICPCSGGTLSAVAHAASGNLIQRAADVHLKERRTLVLVPRETPLSVPQLENMRRCAEYGAVVLPAMPGFYHGATKVADLVDFVVARVADHLGVEHGLTRRWGDATTSE